jgi:hypothetical protein
MEKIVGTRNMGDTCKGNPEILGRDWRVKKGGNVRGTL